jgi:hypothetical protein
LNSLSALGAVVTGWRTCSAAGELGSAKATGGGEPTTAATRPRTAASRNAAEAASMVLSDPRMPSA